MPKFRPGDIVEYCKRKHFSIQERIGSIARVEGIDNGYITITWLFPAWKEMDEPGEQVQMYPQVFKAIARAPRPPKHAAL